MTSRQQRDELEALQREIRSMETELQSLVEKLEPLRARAAISAQWRHEAVVAMNVARTFNNGLRTAIEALQTVERDAGAH
jgi:hypothetical protein